MNIVLVILPIIAAYVVGVAILRTLDKKHPNNGKEVEQALRKHP